jgi:hypothetical protein
MLAILANTHQHSPRAPLVPLSLNPPSPAPASRTPTHKHTVADLLCDEAMPTPAELYTEVHNANLNVKVQNADLYAEVQNACWCFDQCPASAPCKHARPIRPFPAPNTKRKRDASPPRSRDTAPALNWVQTINLWHACEFERTVVTMDCNRTFRAIFDELCRDERVERRSVQFVWNRKRSCGRTQLVVLKESDTPLDVGMRSGSEETVESEFV